MEGWPTETIFFFSIFLLFFPWSYLGVLLVCVESELIAVETLYKKKTVKIFNF
jgi:hypothetical protein